MRNDDFLTRGTLTFINENRVSRGLKALDDLPLGHPVSAVSCPVSLAFVLDTDGFAASTRWETYINAPGDAQVEITHSDCVSEWIRRFDARAYPQYVRSPRA